MYYGPRYKTDIKPYKTALAHNVVCLMRARDDKKIRRIKNAAQMYEITPDEYHVFLKKQKYCCRICGISEKDLKKPLCVDHCHNTNFVRGLLCNHCNSMLGFARDMPIVLRKGAKYLMAAKKAAQKLIVNSIIAIA